ncbi:hypothetical protein [Leptospira neocaledonica]|uniref:Uncharacterized protein n=1 Tax=Leptospira neocaledonica TaxID=2023192 RepID=A0A2N0A2K6_9LEPT|nr:hypothetical protein [Leptospira neocaledonica]PJZ78547.1 hypothetical protein CH365_04380 [Leptospira neocaledonica]
MKQKWSKIFKMERKPTVNSERLMEVILKFQYVIVISFFVLINIGCQISKKETFELLHIRKTHLQEIDFRKAEYNKDAEIYSQFINGLGYSYMIAWQNKASIISESLTKGDAREIFTYQDGKLSMKAKMKRYAFEPYYKESVNTNEQTEDSIFYYLKNK